MMLDLDVWVFQEHPFIWSLLVARSICQALRENTYVTDLRRQSKEELIKV